MIYALKGNRPGFDIRETDEVKHCDDGYTTVHRNGECFGVYMTCLLAGRPKDAPVRAIGEQA